MFNIEINGKPTDCEINFGTALDYELEFGKDMVADMNGSVSKGDASFITLADDGETIIGIDFRTVPWTKLLQVLWCAVKTANPKTKPFRKWAEEMRGIDMFEARIRLSEEMEDCFFRSPALEPEEQGK